MPAEAAVIALLRTVAGHPAARGLADDAAVIDMPLGRQLVATHDVLVENVHYTATCPPADVAWKLVACNLSDLAAMGARPLGMLLGLTLAPAQTAGWLAEFVRGLGAAADRWGCPLLGGDTVGMGDGASSGGRAVLGLTALGTVLPGMALGRGGARAGDDLWASGSIGGAGLGLAMALGQADIVPALLARYRRPQPRLALGRALVGVAHAAMDISDGLLLDASRLAAASGLAVQVRLADVPVAGDAAGEADILAAATAGDDYELLFAAAPDAADAVHAAAGACRTPVARIGHFSSGAGLAVLGLAGGIVLPARLGHAHTTAD
jgi:thiamine-monophosphate kinase